MTIGGADDQPIEGRLPDERDPLAYFQRGGGCGKQRLKPGEGSEVVANLIRERAGGYTALVGSHDLPEERMHQMLRCAHRNQVLQMPEPG